MQELVDLHTHILPGLDDGPEDAAESLRMLDGLGTLGFSHVFATPHHRLHTWQGLDTEVVVRGVAKLRDLLPAGAAAIRLYCGMEFDLDESLAERTIRRPGAGGPLLVDIGFWGLPRNLAGLLETVSGRGKPVCLVHPERNGEFSRDHPLVAGFVEKGFRLVGNLGSLSGMYGEEVRGRALETLEKGLYWAFSSDLHSERQLDWIARGIEGLIAAVGRDAARQLLHGNPMEAVIGMEEKP